VFIIVNCNVIVALNSDVACCHFYAVWVDDITFNRLTYTTYFILFFYKKVAIFIALLSSLAFCLRSCSIAASFRLSWAWCRAIIRWLALRNLADLHVNSSIVPLHVYSHLTLFYNPQWQTCADKLTLLCHKSSILA
jgi:hypothetical protein